jgi:Raf kinase inhibitor-like YbhB/YbcL family protein
MGTQRVLAKITVAVAVVLLAGCATGDGKTLQPPTAPAPTTSAPPGVPSDDVGDTALTLPGEEERSLEIAVPWVPGAEMDPRFGCAGEGLSPSVAWESVPEGTSEIAIVISDQAGRVHWMLLGISPEVIALPEAVSAEGLARQGVQVISNDFGVADWTPPCPPAGTSEMFLVSVHALSQQIEGAATMRPAEIADLLGFVSLGIAEVTGVYSRPA